MNHHFFFPTIALENAILRIFRCAFISRKIMFIGLLMQFIRLIYANKIEQTAKCTGTHTQIALAHNLKCIRDWNYCSRLHNKLNKQLTVGSNRIEPNQTKSNDIDSSVHCKTPVGREKQRSLCKWIINKNAPQQTQRNDNKNNHIWNARMRNSRSPSTQKKPHTKHWN